MFVAPAVDTESRMNSHHVLLLFFSFLAVPQYINRGASAVRGALKEPAKLKVKGQDAFSYNVSTWSNGVQSSKTPIDTLAAAGK
jgi:hypothetical protein